MVVTWNLRASDRLMRGSADVGLFDAMVSTEFSRSWENVSSPFRDVNGQQN